MEARAASPQADSTCSRKEGTNAFLQIGVRCCSSFIASAKKRNVVVFRGDTTSKPVLEGDISTNRGAGAKKNSSRWLAREQKKSSST